MKKEKILTFQEQQWIEHLLKLWGAWEYEGIDFTQKMSVLAKLMQTVNPEPLPSRTRCDDELGMLINAVIARCVKRTHPTDYQYLYAKYVYGRAERAIADYIFSQKIPDNRCQGKAPSLSTCRRRVSVSIERSEMIIAKFLNATLKNHPNRKYFRQFAFSD